MKLPSVMFPNWDTSSRFLRRFLPGLAPVARGAANRCPDKCVRARFSAGVSERRGPFQAPFLYASPHTVTILFRLHIGTQIIMGNGQQTAMPWPDKLPVTAVVSEGTHAKIIYLNRSVGFSLCQWPAANPVETEHCGGLWVPSAILRRMQFFVLLRITPCWLGQRCSEFFLCWSLDFLIHVLVAL